MGRSKNARHDPLYRMRDGRAVHGKNRNAFSDALFHHSDDSAFGQKENDRMPELQGAVSDGVKMISRILIVLLFFASCSKTPNENVVNLQSPIPKTELKTDVPNESWVRSYFEEFYKNDYGINKVAAMDGFSKLKETVLPKGDLEIRVWVGFGIYGIDGFILRRSAGNWSAVVLKRMLCHLEKKGKYELSSPKSGWDTTWQKLVNAGILTLPDSSKLKYEDDVIDGKSYVVETNSDSLYRTYHYTNPKYVKLKEAEQMVKIGQIIADEFNLESFSAEKGGCGKNE